MKRLQVNSPSSRYSQQPIKSSSARINRTLLSHQKPFSFNNNNMQSPTIPNKIFRHPGTSVDSFSNPMQWKQHNVVDPVVGVASNDTKMHFQTHSNNNLMHSQSKRFPAFDKVMDNNGAQNISSFQLGESIGHSENFSNPVANNYYLNNGSPGLNESVPIRDSYQVYPNCINTSAHNQVTESLSYEGSGMAYLSTNSTCNIGMMENNEPTFDGMYQQLDYNNSDVRHSSSPNGSEPSIHMDYETASTHSINSTSPFVENTMNLGQTNVNSDPNEDFRNSISRNSQMSGFEYIQNDDLSDLAQQIVDNYQSTGTVQVQTEYLSPHNGVQMNYVDNYSPITDLAVNNDKSYHSDMTDVNRSNDAIKSCLDMNNINSPISNVEDPFRNKKVFNNMVTKTEPDFSSPPLPFDLTDRGSHSANYNSSTLDSNSNAVFAKPELCEDSILPGFNTSLNVPLGMMTKNSVFSGKTNTRNSVGIAEPGSGVSSSSGRPMRIRRQNSWTKYDNNISLKRKRKNSTKTSDYEVAAHESKFPKKEGLSIPVIRIRKKNSLSEGDSSDIVTKLNPAVHVSNDSPDFAPSPSRRLGSTDTRDSHGAPRNISNCYPAGMKICGVCGDVAKSMHFGGMACDSCKAFFRRSVQGDSYKQFRCMADSNCTISKKNRKNCQKCRFTMCKNNGMDPSQVMSEAARIALWKSRLSKHRQDSSENHNKTKPKVESELDHSQSFTSSRNSPIANSDFSCDESKPGNASDRKKKPTNKKRKNSVLDEVVSEDNTSKISQDSSQNVSEFTNIQDTLDVTVNEKQYSLVSSMCVTGTNISEFSEDHPMSAEDLLKMNDLIALQAAVNQAYPFPKYCHGNSIESLSNIFVILCKKIGNFYHRVEEFNSLCREDQMMLLRSGISKTVYLHGAYNYDDGRKCWPRKEARDGLRVPYLSNETLYKFAKIPEVYNMIIDFYVTYGPDLQDEGILAIVTLLAVFQISDASEQILEKKTVSNIRDYYIDLLVKYLKYRRGERGPDDLPRILKGLEVTREISEFHTKIDINPTMNASEMAITPCSSSFTNQLTDVCDYLKNSSSNSLSEFSSVLSFKERVESINGPDSPLSILDNPKIPVDIQYHHPLTSALFGGNNRTDMLLTNALEHIAQYKQQLLSLPYEPVSLQVYGKNPSAVEIGKLSPSTNKSNDKEDSHDDGKCINLSIKSKPSTSAVSIPVANPRQQLNDSLPSTSRNSPSPNGSTVEASTSNKKKGIKVLCEMLEYISKSDDPEAIESLKSSLSPYVLDNLAAKLNFK